MLFCSALLALSCVLVRMAHPFAPRSAELLYDIQQESSPFGADLSAYKELEKTLRATGHYYELYAQYLERTEQSAGMSFYSVESEQPEADAAEIPSLQMDSAALRRYGLEAAEGRLFEEGDFLLEENAPVPVLLGAAYQGLYRPGDRFEAVYLYSKLPFQVVGILKPSKKLPNVRPRYAIDRNVILPMFDPVSPESRFDAKGLQIHYANRVSGFMLFPRDGSAEGIRSLKEVLAASDCGDFSWTVYPYADWFRDKTGLSAAQWVILCVLASVLFAAAAWLLKRIRRQKQGAENAGQLNKF